MKFGLTFAAADDLEKLRQFIERENPRAAAETVATLLRAARELVKFPGRGRAGRLPGTRELILSPYIIIYTVDAGDLIVVRVLHGARKWP